MNSSVSEPTTSPDPVPSEESAAHPFNSGLLWHTRWTIPLHVALPVAFCWLIQQDSSLAMKTFWSVHSGFPLLLLVTVRWWWQRIGELVALLFINHMVTFAVLLFLPWQSLFE